jgi:hypothetical protein
VKIGLFEAEQRHLLEVVMELLPTNSGFRHHAPIMLSVSAVLAHHRFSSNLQMESFLFKFDYCRKQRININLSNSSVLLFLSVGLFQQKPPNKACTRQVGFCAI